MRIGFFSCQEFIAGFYAAHATSPRRTSTWSSAWATTSTSRLLRRARRARRHDRPGDGEAQTLAEYRRKYPLYHTDANLPRPAASSPSSASGTTTRSRTTTPARRRRARPTPPRALRRAPPNGYRACFEHMPRRLRGAVADRIYGRCRWATPTVPARHAPVPRRPAVQRRRPPRRARTTTDDPARTLLGAEQKAWLKGALGALARALEGDRQPGDDLLARRAAAQRRSTTTRGTATGPTARSSSTTSPRSDRRRHLRDRRHPHLLRRRRHPYRPPVRSRRGRHRSAQRAVARDRVRGRRHHLAGHRRSRRVHEAQRVAAARRPTPRCWPTTRSSPTPTRPTRATASSRPAPAGSASATRRSTSSAAPDSGVFTLRRFRVDAGRPVVIDEGGPAPI